MKKLDLHNKNEEELQELLADKRERRRELNFQLASGKVQDTSEVRKVKKDIARILTQLNQRKNA